MSFRGRVVIVTGAGNGLGRGYALYMASRGAKVVVNDLGGAVDGSGAGTRAADAVVEQIRAAGGVACASYDSVSDGDRIVATAIREFGRVDAVVANAGILRDASFGKMTDAQWDAVYGVHVAGAFSVVRAAWPHMRQQGFGRVVLVSSSTGLYGNFGQANYGAAKGAALGLAAALSVEGKSRGVLVNCVSPIAASRMTQDVMPPDLLEALQPEAAAPVVAFLCHEDCRSTGRVVEVGAGWAAAVRWERSKGAHALEPAPSGGVADRASIEAAASAWPGLSRWEGASHPATTQSAFEPMLAARALVRPGNSVADAAGGTGDDDFGAGAAATRAAPAEGGASREALLPELGGGRTGVSDAVDAARACEHRLEPSRLEYSERDSALYALAVGAGADDATSPLALRAAYETTAVLPSMAVLWPHPVLEALPSVPGLSFDPTMLLHGEQDLVIARDPADGKPVALPAAARVVTSARVQGVFDKGSGALIVADAHTSEAGGRTLAANRVSVFVRGIGGFGGDRAPRTAAPSVAVPRREPTASRAWRVPSSAALLYRLCGDENPLHADPDFAGAAGFPRPILHGLASFGCAVRHLVETVCDGNERRVARVKARFSAPVVPGDTLVTQAWVMGQSPWAADCQLVAFRVLCLRASGDDASAVEAVSQGEAHVIAPGGADPRHSRL